MLSSLLRVNRYDVLPGHDSPLKVMGIRYTTRCLSYLLLTFLVLGFILYVHVPQQSAWRLPSEEYLYDYMEEEPLDADQLCQFPNPNPYDESLLPYVFQPVPIRCKARGEQLTYLDADGRLCFNETALKVSGYSQSSLSCTYQEVVRPDGDDDSVTYGPAVAMSNGMTLASEFVSVKCINFAGITVYSNFHAHIVRQKDIPERPMEFPGVKPPRRLFSFLFFVIDSMSRLNFIRQLPKTYFQLTRNMGAVVLRGMTKVGDNTHPNIVPILTGRTDRSVPELVSSVNVDTHYLQEPGPSESFDDWPFTWKNLTKLGYATLLAEDQPQFAVFNYLMKGFRDPPTQHYLRPFWLALESSIVHRMSSNLCFASMPKHLIQMRYVEDFMQKYRHVPYFGLSILTEISHDFVNQVGSADDDFAAFLSRLQRDSLLEDTLLVVMGDHGPRFDAIVWTPIGSIENRMPLTAVVVPPALQEHFPQAMAHLRANARRLTTVFDLHATMLDLVHYGAGRRRAALGERDASLEDSAWGQSLLTPLSPKRTCLQAGVPHYYCTCEAEHPVSVREPHVVAAAHVLLVSLNEATEHVRMFCVAVSLKSVQRATALLPHEWADAAAGTADVKLRVTVQVSPSDGLFEGLVFASGNGTVTVLDDIDRVNRYGTEAHCLPPEILRQNPRLNLYCYCAV